MASSAVLKDAKRAKKTIESFFAPKQQQKPGPSLDEQPFSGVATRAAPAGAEPGQAAGRMSPEAAALGDAGAAAGMSPRAQRAAARKRKMEIDADAPSVAAPAPVEDAAGGTAEPANVPEAASAPPAEAVDDGLTPAQRAQIAANRNRALARLAVTQASAPGAPPLALASLLTEPSWQEVLGPQLATPGMRSLEAFLRGEWAPGKKPVFPPRDAVFQAFNACPFDRVRVVILGQDPYHGPGQAMGLSFSVPPGCALPPSLLNIYKEAQTDLGWADRPTKGDLTSWSVQGVLLLNTCLTVRQGEANSHSKRGWEAFTDAAIRALSQKRAGIVFLLWGNPAQAKAALIDTSKHHVLRSAHPSPLSASRGFFGCRHFSQANALLEKQGLTPIEWRPT
ncbi:hypothetical protein HYH03_008853 [Edaphochlamys debaryana]|uniref:Uracil-DNA glycosylase n=1 Tax=Edaphochlamys debaryana TaxID=47281 RepID=A0A835XZL9_9CHLO|nr:hypothetical protein HYH03_008853 [Edaphochlamys debaryana]|eukprot:KAG2492945.1 hypothetical protein HYH03_008853 [Edaphochlamys debaryana]